MHVSIAFMEAFRSPVFHTNFSNGIVEILRYPMVKGDGLAGVKVAIYVESPTSHFKLLC